MKKKPFCVPLVFVIPVDTKDICTTSTVELDRTPYDFQDNGNGDILIFR